MTDALGFFPATRVLLATPPDEESYWLERGLLEKARALTAVAVAQVVVPVRGETIWPTPSTDEAVYRWANRPRPTSLGRTPKERSNQ
jgi:hypothetical protein